MLVIWAANNEKTCIVERILVFLFFFYRAWYEQVVGYSAIILYGIVGLLSLLVLFRMSKNRTFQIRYMPSILKMYFIFLVYSLSGFLVAVDRSVVLTSLITLFSNIILCFYCWYISFQIENYSWLYKILKWIALICVFQVIFFGQPYLNGVTVTTMSATNNPNDLGLVLLLGIIAFVMDLDPTSLRSFCLTLPFNFLLLYGIMLTASRKCFLSAAAVIIFWILYSLVMMLQKNKAKDFFVVLFLIGLAAGIGLYFFNTQFQSSAILERLTGLFSEGGTTKRASLYKEAIAFFKQSPVIGIGYAQFAQHSSFGTYSHSSYAEILSCGGVIGTLIFFLPIAVGLIRCIRKAFARDHLDRLYRNRMVLLIFCCELFLGVGQIFIYGVFHLLILMLIFMEIEQGSTNAVNYKISPVKVKLVHSTRRNPGIIRTGTTIQ